jgi:hypothetical protein
LFVYVSLRRGLPTDSDSGFELSTTGWSWLMFGGLDDVDQLSRTLRRFENVPESVIDGSTSSYEWSMRPVIGND